MKNKIFKQTILNFHEDEKKPLRFEDILVCNGDLLQYDIGEVVTIENRTVRGSKRYRVSKIESSVDSPYLLILEKPEHEPLRKIFVPQETVIRKIYDLYPTENKD